MKDYVFYWTYWMKVLTSETYEISFWTNSIFSTTNQLQLSTTHLWYFLSLTRVITTLHNSCHWRCVTIFHGCGANEITIVPTLFICTMVINWDSVINLHNDFSAYYVTQNTCLLVIVVSLVLQGFFPGLCKKTALLENRMQPWWININSKIWKW